MPELDALDPRDTGAAFDDRLRAAVRGFADAAQTDVDAVVVAERAIRHRRTGPFAWLGEAVPVPVPVLVVLGLLILVLVMTLGIGASREPRGSTLPVAIASPSPAAPTVKPSPAPSPLPPPDGEGDEAVAGTESVTRTTLPVETVVGDITRQRDGVITTRASMNDVRVDGNGVWQLSADLRSGTGPAWGPYRLESIGGAWEGSCTGSLWADGAGGARNCWLAGSGDYDGYTYYLSATWSDTGGDVRGVIYPGSPPAP